MGSLSVERFSKNLPPLSQELRFSARYLSSQKEGKPMVNQMVLSTEIEWIGYEKNTRMLQVEFLSGSVYQYDNVPEHLYYDFLAASSYGHFLDEEIKGRFNYRKVR